MLSFKIVAPRPSHRMPFSEGTIEEFWGRLGVEPTLVVGVITVHSLILQGRKGPSSAGKTVQISILNF